MKGKKWIAGALSVLAIGATLAISQPAVTYATETPAVENTERGGFGARLGAGIGRIQGNMIDLISSILGVDRTEVITERQSGKSMVEIAEEKGVDEQKLVDSILEERKTALEESVKEGRITQEQAEFCEENMEQRIREGLNRTEVGPRGNGGKRGMRGGMHRGAGMWNQQVQQ